MEKNWAFYKYLVSRRFGEKRKWFRQTFRCGLLWEGVFLQAHTGCVFSFVDNLGFVYKEGWFGWSTSKVHQVQVGQHVSFKDHHNLPNRSIHQRKALNLLCCFFSLFYQFQVCRNSKKMMVLQDQTSIRAHSQCSNSILFSRLDILLLFFLP